MATAERVDAHHHVWDLSARAQPWTQGLPVLQRSFAFSELKPQLHDQRISRTIVVQTVSDAAETLELLALAAAEPMIGGVVGWIDLTAADVSEQLAVLVQADPAHKLVGMRHQVQHEPDPRWLCRPAVRRGLTELAAVGLSFDLLIVPAQLPAAIETVNALAQLRFVLDHGAKPHIDGRNFAQWQRDIAALAASPNVVAKLSGLVTEAEHRSWNAAQLHPFSTTLLQAFSPARVMFGSDWPVCLLATDYPGVIGLAEALTSHLSNTESAQVFGATAIRSYGMGPA